MTRLQLFALDQPPRREPKTVTALRSQIRRGASEAVLCRIAGGEGELRRMRAEYGLELPKGLDAKPKPSPWPALLVSRPAHRPAGDMRGNQAVLLDMARSLAEAGEIFPPAHANARVLGCSYLVIERDLRVLVRKGRISVGWYRCQGVPVRRVTLVGRNLATALPPARAAEGRERHDGKDRCFQGHDPGRRLRPPRGAPAVLRG